MAKKKKTQENNLLQFDVYEADSKKLEAFYLSQDLISHYVCVSVESEFTA